MSEPPRKVPVTHEEIANRLDKVEDRLRDGSGEFADIKSEMADIRGKLECIDASAARRMEKIEAVAADMSAVRELVEVMAVAKRAGRVAKFMGRVFGWLFNRIVGLIKWGGALAAALAAFFVFWREFAQFFFNPKG